MTEHNMISAFIILHYKAIDDTIKCIDSIMNMDEFNECGIVIVDNASPDGSGKELQKKYGDNANVEIVLNNENLGFSKANNIGVKVAQDKWNPDFYVVANNDILFTQKSFVKIVSEKYSEHRFAVLGPDIFNTRQNVHQSPMGKEPPSLKRARRTVILNQLSLALFPIMYPLLKRWFSNLEGNMHDAKLYDLEQIDVYLQGACVVFSKEYISDRGLAYFPETFFYSEEALFTLWCMRNNKTIVYTPDIVVHHNESSSTYSETDRRKRIRFQMTNILKATKVYISELKKN